MSLVVAVQKSDRVEVMTDAMVCSAKTGVALQFAPKQIIEPIAKTVIVPLSWIPVAARFARLAGERCKSFDELVARADDLYSEALTIIPNETYLTEAGIEFFGVTFAGWSEKANGPKIFTIDNRENPKALDYEITVMHPCDDAQADVADLIDRFENLAACRA